MTEETFETQCGAIHYWISKDAEASKPSLVFLPGLTADHRLFNKQIEYFEGKYPVCVWDAPGLSVLPLEVSFENRDERCRHVGIRKETDARDHAGSCIRYNKAWHKKAGIQIEWIKGAGHNANTDRPAVSDKPNGDLQRTGRYETIHPYSSG